MRLFAVLHNKYMFQECRLRYSMANAVIFLFFCAIYGYFVRQTRADALRHGSQNTIMLEKTAKIFCIVCHWNTAPTSQRDISYLCKTEKEINNIVVGDKL